MMLSERSAEVFRLAVNGEVEEALRLAHATLDDAALVAAAGVDAAGLWYAVAAAELFDGNFTDAVSAAAHCITTAREHDSAGWVSCGLSVRAMANVRMQRLDEALHDLASSEAELESCHDQALRCWAHTGLGYTYQELRLYELAEPHLVAAQQLDASPMPFADAPVIDLMNLADMYARWADELERARPHPGAWQEAARHRLRANGYATLAVAKARRLSSGLLPSAQAVELCTRPRNLAEVSVPELRAAYEATRHHELLGSRALVGGALARALWRTGEEDESLAVAREAVRASTGATDWQVEASARWLLVEMEHEAGLPGSTAGRDYARLLSRVLWRQRLSTLAGAEATLAMDRLRRDNTTARREAHEDPLTGVGNRRALDGALGEVGHDQRRGGEPTSMLLVDLDGFKAFNDSYGHVVGDRVLRAVADAIRGAARAEDLVARLGGDEFVVLARGTDEAAARQLAGRVRDALAAVRVDTPDGPRSIAASVGVRTTGDELAVADLLNAADEAMYGVKRSLH